MIKSERMMRRSFTLITRKCAHKLIKKLSLTWTWCIDMKFTFANGRDEVMRVRVDEQYVDVELKATVWYSTLKRRRVRWRVECDQHFTAPENERREYERMVSIKVEMSTKISAKEEKFFAPFYLPWHNLWQPVATAKLRQNGIVGGTSIIKY